VIKKLENIKEIPIKDIEINSLFQNRWSYSIKDAELIDSINVIGLILPVIVRPINSGENRYTLVDGYRRIKVKQLLGHETIMCKVVELSDSDAIGFYLSSHIGCKELTYEQKKHSIETFRGMMKYMEKRGTIEKDKLEKLEEYARGLEIRNKPPKKITGSYYCPICNHKHIRGQIYEEHKRYAEVEQEE